MFKLQLELPILSIRKMTRSLPMLIPANVNSSISFFQVLSRQYAVTGKKKKTFEKTIVDIIQLADPEKADKLKKQLDDADQATAQLRSGKANAAQSRKAAAAQKIQRIKEEIRILMRMGGDPKMIAKQIRKLAKELAAAVREYASSGGASSLDNVAATDATASNSVANNTLSNVAQSDSATGKGETAVITSAVPVSCESAAAEKEEEKNDNVTSCAPTTAQDNGVQQYQETLRQQSKNYWQNKSNELAQKNSVAGTDRDFVREVRTLAAYLKMLAAQQKRRLSDKGDHSADNEITQTGQALAEVEKSLSGMDSSSMITTV
jgi:hypothetical protein